MKSARGTERADEEREGDGESRMKSVRGAERAG